MLQTFSYLFFFLIFHTYFLMGDNLHIAWAVIGKFRRLTAPAVIMDSMHGMPVVWSYLFWSSLLFVSLTELTCRTTKNYWDFFAGVVLGFGFNVNGLHIHNLRTAGYSKHIVICKPLKPFQSHLEAVLELRFFKFFFCLAYLHLKSGCCHQRGCWF